MSNLYQMGGRRLLSLTVLFLWGLYPGNPQVAFAQTSTNFPETFEAGTKASYATGAVVLPSGSWSLEEALVGTSDADRKNGLKSVRLRQNGKLTMDFYLPDGAGAVTVKHGIYGSDGSSAWELC